MLSLCHTHTRAHAHETQTKERWNNRIFQWTKCGKGILLLLFLWILWWPAVVFSYAFVHSCPVQTSKDDDALHVHIIHIHARYSFWPRKSLHSIDSCACMWNCVTGPVQVIECHVNLAYYANGPLLSHCLVSESRKTQILVKATSDVNKYFRNRKVHRSGFGKCLV